MDPAGHLVSAGRAMVNVEDEDSDDDGEGDENHGEEEILANERDDEGCGWNDLCDEEEEHSEGQQHGDAKSDLLATVRGEVENQDGQAGDEQTGDDEVDGVEQGKPPDDEEVRDVWVYLMAAVVFLCIVRPHSVDDGPFATLPVVIQVHAVFDLLQVDLGLIVCPGAKFHFTVLLIEGEEGDVDAAGAFVDSRRNPANLTSVEKMSFGHVGHRKLTVSTERENVSELVESTLHITSASCILRTSYSQFINLFSSF